MTGSMAQDGEGRTAWPQNVGILALEVYFPATCVNQTKLEEFDGASAGKYTVGLGQTNMAFCTDREDINSICLTAVQALMDKNGLSYADIGRLEVGTETLIDKSKSVKTVLMQLFTESGNTDVEGVQSTNACYGGTAALFNTLAWVESSAWDGRYGLVVAADIAVYAEGNARPTGGAGAVAMLVGPNAPLVIERGLRGTHMEHVYDFYKPKMESEYPEVDGKLSIECYFRALDKSYERYGARASQAAKGGVRFDVSQADFFVFHSPFNKLVQKSFGRLLFNDYLRNPAAPQFASVPEHLRASRLENTYGDREVEQVFVRLSEGLYNEKVVPSTLLSKQLGNMYTASLYGGLASLFVTQTAAQLAGRRAVLFSYGSGLASSMFSVRFGSEADIAPICERMEDVRTRLESRRFVEPREFESTMQLRDETHNLADYTPVGSVEALFPGAWYLEKVDAKYRRTYSCKAK